MAEYQSNWEASEPDHVDFLLKESSDHLKINPAQEQASIIENPNTRKKKLIIVMTISIILLISLISVAMIFLLPDTNSSSNTSTLTTYSRFLVIGGGRYQKQTEVMDLTDTNITCKTTYRDLESQREYAVGGLINETPIVCGGRNLPEYYDSCITFGQTKTSIKMNEPRSSAASVVLNETTLWIMGGLAGRRRLKSTELITLDPATSVNGPALPKALAGSCAVKYNDTHIYLTGSSNQVWIYNTMLNPGSSLWTEGPRMKNKRSSHGCTVLHHGQKSWIVVAGGYNFYGDFLKSMEILDPNENKWVRGPNLPYKLLGISQAMVTSPDGMGIIIVGGKRGGNIVDYAYSEKRILESRFNGSQFLPWQVIDQELEFKRFGHVVIPIPKSTTNCN